LAITAVGAVHLVRPGTHLTNVQALIAIIAGTGFIKFKKGMASCRFEQAAARAGKAAPNIGNNESSGKTTEDKNAANEPAEARVLEGKEHRLKKLTDADRHIGSRLAENVIDIKSCRQPQVFA
jgi:hypothetical protein